MITDDTRRKIKNIVAGNVIERENDHGTAVRNLLCRCFETSTNVKEDFEGKSIIKKKQADLLEKYCTEHKLWFSNLPSEDRYLTRGGEAKVYILQDNLNVVKINEAVYYATWLEYLNSVLLHNILFENTAYELLGFIKDKANMMAVVKQPFVVADSQVELADIKKFLEFNEFENTNRNDYIHRKLGLILEDMHDENVLVNKETLFFIDSVFYTIIPERL